MMMFIRAEREGDKCLHLQSVMQMLQYFLTAGHINYARYGMVFIIQGQWSHCLNTARKSS